MVALTTDRNTPQLNDPSPAPRRGTVAAAQMIFAGALLMRNAAGHLVKASVAVGLVGAGRADQRVDNLSGVAGAAEVEFSLGSFRFENSAAADLITAADIGAVCYAVDDQTVARTNATNTRSPAGIIDQVDELGVWVKIDPALTKAALS